jgi:hypothetical protein
MELVTIKSYSDPYEANLAKSKLLSEGIDCFIKNENFIAAIPALPGAFGGYQLQCDRRNADRALQVLGE